MHAYMFNVAEDKNTNSLYYIQSSYMTVYLEIHWLYILGLGAIFDDPPPSALVWERAVAGVQ